MMTHFSDLYMYSCLGFNQLITVTWFFWMSWYPTVKKSILNLMTSWPQSHDWLKHWSQRTYNTSYLEKFPSRMCILTYWVSKQWSHNGCNSISIHRHLHYLLNRLFRRRSKKTSKLCVTALCLGNPPVTDGFPSQRARNVENFQFHDAIM